MTILFCILSFLVGLGVGIALSIYYLKRKAMNALKSAFNGKSMADLMSKFPMPERFPMKED